MTPCPCARAWLAEMVEEGLRRKPKGEGATWLVDWLLRQATNLPIARQNTIMRELGDKTRLRKEAEDLKRAWGVIDRMLGEGKLNKATRSVLQEEKKQIGEKILELEKKI